MFLSDRIPIYLIVKSPTNTSPAIPTRRASTRKSKNHGPIYITCVSADQNVRFRIESDAMSRAAHRTPGCRILLLGAKGWE